MIFVPYKVYFYSYPMSLEAFLFDSSPAVLQRHIQTTNLILGRVTASLIPAASF